MQLNTKVEKISYIFGQQIGGDFKRQDLEVNIEILVQSIRDAYEGKEPEMAQEEVQAVMTEFNQKMQAKMQEQQSKVAEQNVEIGNKYLEENKKADGVQVTESGLQYKIIEEGNGKKPEASETVEVHYEGKLINGQIFDSSIQRGEPISFPVNGVILGWQEALQLMPVGSKWEITIPAELAYGANGAGQAIGPNETLVFYVELLNIK